MTGVNRRKIPVLLLKTKSVPVDTYEEHFAALSDEQYVPHFVPVLEHRFKQDALDRVRQHIVNGDFASNDAGAGPMYGALIFTSQRAVEAFTGIIEAIRRDGAPSLESCLPESVPLYVVGPATARGLRALKLPNDILGEETGNGDSLSSFILEHYNGVHQGAGKPRILFLVGEKRRDIIPNTLQSEALPLERRSEVHELVIYETGEMQSFQAAFSALSQTNAEVGNRRQWVVVFSPQGCRAMLESLGFLDLQSGKALPRKSRDVSIATIGPTTRDYLVNEFGFTPDTFPLNAIMAGTRSSTRNSSSPKKEENAAGTKRKAGTTSPKRERKAAKKQTTIEQTMGGDTTIDVSEDTEMKESPDEREEQEKNIDNGEGAPAETKDDSPETEATETRNANGVDQAEAAAATKDEPAHDETSGDNTIQESPQREKKLPSSILEKGVIYFFTRNRVGIKDAESVGDLQRTYFVLRPLPKYAKLGDGALPDSSNNRLFALPKKVFPKSHSDRFMTFVEKAPTTIQDLKDNFFKGNSYETKTAGTRQVDPVTTAAEGVYAITRTEDRSTHLVYAITIPSNLGEVQEDLGLKPQGSFIFSVKNPERSGPANASLPQRPDFPKEIVEEFRGLAWSEVKPKYLDYPNAQFLLIGEKLDHAAEPTTKDKKHGREAPKEELEKLEHEDELRVEHLQGDDSVFDDLKISKKDYPKVPTTW
ncbi:tetrapyrrole biosynthesis, uroporphyrinogen III synthase [Lentithecium fluviatile CBS 122367]|uniref:Tetrapyrrole biosynthesis, uroporphyrinogen III synthase n=1 Tax=Lentithecium fluviatile CBS 122367 TaxID=1168545 RepID=A0A6G1JCM8_9PLEO|nr:tetrapyrrole biosynthesis, uroporphyrinogen III synthase [Lentithecium fluviatile CBS 122367]